MDVTIRVLLDIVLLPFDLTDLVSGTLLELYHYLGSNGRSKIIKIKVPCYSMGALSLLRQNKCDIPI